MYCNIHSISSVIISLWVNDHRVCVGGIKHVFLYAENLQKSFQIEKKKEESEAMNVSVFGNVGRPVTSFSVSTNKSSKPMRGSVLGSSLATTNSTKYQQTSKGILLPKKDCDIRPKTRSSLGVKNWRASIFPSSSPASKREVELLGEWLNSVLAENLETNENPLDVCTNAQHWFSVAFNELLRQVSVSCAERGRLFAVIWKRNQDLLSKLVQIQKNERKYILECHKDRVQFLKTDLEFCNSRLDTVQSAYNEELTRWKEAHERDTTKFTNLQQKIDEQAASRKELIGQLKVLQKKLGIESNVEIEQKRVPAPQFSLEEMRADLQEMRVKIRSKNMPSNQEFIDVMNDFEHYLKYKKLNPSISGVKATYEEYFLSLPAEEKGTVRDLPWLAAILSYISSNYLAAIESMGLDKLQNTPFSRFIYNTLMGFYGVRECAEKTMLDLLVTIASARNESSRAMIFSRFIGLNDPYPPEALPFYMYCLSSINKEHPGPLFPEIEGNDPLTGAVPAQSVTSASEKIIKKFAEERSFKFFMERITKLANDGTLRFGGRNIAELDSALSFLTDSYVDENVKYDSLSQEAFDNVNGQCETYSQFRTLFGPSRREIDDSDMPKIMMKILHDGEINRQSFSEAVKPYGFFAAFQLKLEDFCTNQNPEDIVHFVKLEVEYWEPKYQAALRITQELGDDISAKQLRAAKAKMEQALVGRTLGKTANNLIREFFERVYLTNFQHV